MTDILVEKRDGRKEPLDIEKIHRVVTWACEGCQNVSASEIEQTAHIKFYNGIKSSDLHESLVKSAHELITKDNQYDLVAGRLAMFDVRKRAFGQFEPPHLLNVVKKNVADGWYHPDVLNMYTEEEWDKLNGYIRHERDFTIPIAGVAEWRSKYIVQNRVSKEFRESPQIAYMMVAAIMQKPNGLRDVRDYYNDISNYTTTIPTPLIAGMRTKVKQFSSCVLIESDDSLDSISATADASMKYASRKAGLGISVAHLRAENQPVRGGDAYTTGPIPFTQFVEKSVLMCSQGGIRKGSVNFNHLGWHLDIQKLMVLKNNKGTEETRVRHSDHTILLNGFLLKKMMKNEDIHLFSPEEVPDLKAAFYADQELFAKLYDKYSRSRSLTTETIGGAELRNLFCAERQGTSRVYAMFVDNVNEQGSYIPAYAPVKMTNLCVEITQPTNPLQFQDDPNGLIALCTLSAINFGEISKPEDLEHPCRRAVRGLDHLLDYQEYPLEAARNHTMMYRPLGIGVNNLAYFLAKRGLKYGEPEALAVVDEYMEAFSYYLIKASVDLAKERGACGAYKHTKYSQGIVPMDVRKKAVDELVPHNPRMNWDGLKADLMEYGIRNATLMACMPSETSSKIANCTNGVEPVRSLVITKRGWKIVAPHAHRIGNKYDILWDQKDPVGYLHTMAVVQKWIDQTISTNTTYNLDHFGGESISVAVVFRHILTAYKYGLKTLYYNNNLKRAEVVDEEDDQALPDLPSESGGEDEVCESCAL